MPWIRGSLWSIEGSVAARSTYRNTVGHSATVARRVTSILTACSPTISMAGSGGAATRRTYRDTVGYSAIVAGRVGAYYPYRLYAYRYAPGIGLPPYRECPTRAGPGFSGKAGGKAPGASAPGPGDSWRVRRSSHSTRHVVACCCRLQLFLCLVVEVWIMWG